MVIVEDGGVSEGDAVGPPRVPREAPSKSSGLLNSLLTKFTFKRNEKKAVYEEVPEGNAVEPPRVPRIAPSTASGLLNYLQSLGLKKGIKIKKVVMVVDEKVPEGDAVCVAQGPTGNRHLWVCWVTYKVKVQKEQEERIYDRGQGGQRVGLGLESKQEVPRVGDTVEDEL